MSFNYNQILDQEQDVFFGKNIIAWYHEHKRDLPWRNTKNPYFIWLSEVILQQTRVNQGMPYYLKFIEQYPCVEDLAKAPEDEVLRLWQGLGYYARARNMHNTAKMVVEQFNGIFPNNFLELLQLKGVGNYTASAIASFAYNEAVAVLDGNVYRVLARYFGIKDAINAPISAKNFQKLAQKMLLLDSPNIYNQAIMEFGALHCTPDNPNCMFCPLQSVCVAFQTQQQKFLPYKIPKKAIKQRFFTYFVWKNTENQGQENQETYFALQKRGKGDIWEGLYQFILLEQEQEFFEQEVFEQVDEKLFAEKTFVQQDKITEKSLFYEKLSEKTFFSLPKNPKNKGLYTHLLTHQKLFIRFVELETNLSLIQAQNILPENIHFYTQKEVKNLPKPILLANYFEGNF